MYEKKSAVVDITKPEWLRYAINCSEKILRERYLPSEEALDIFDQERSMSKVATKYYF